MERGDDKSVHIAVLSILGIVGMLACVALFLKQPTGFVAQGQDVYYTEDAGIVGIICQNPLNKAAYLGSNAGYATFCCIENLIGQNECKYPHHVLIT